LLSFESRKEKKNVEKRNNERAIVADWPIEKRLSSIDAFFSLVLVVDWRKINDREKEKMREIRDTHTAGR
jgi:hypothetical protein